MKLETLAVLVKRIEKALLILDVLENVLDIVIQEHPEIVTRAIIKTMKGKDENDDY